MNSQDIECPRELEKNSWLKTISGRVDHEPVLFVALLLASLAPLALVQRMPSSDGPAHVANAFVMKNYENPAYPIFSSYYEFNPRPVPNYLTHILLIGFEYLGSPEAAEKLLVGLYVLLLPLAARFALTAIQPGSGFVAVLVFPFIYNLPLHNGMYNFSLGLPLFFVIFAYLFKRSQGLSVRDTAVLSLLLMLAYSLHVVPFAVTALGGGLLLVSRWWKGVRAGLGWLVAARRYLLPFAVALAPAVVLSLIYVSGRRNTPQYTIHTIDRLIQLVTCYSLVSFSRSEAVLSMAVAAVFGAIAFWVWRRRPDSPEASTLLLIAAGCTVLYLITPNQFGNGTHITERVLLLVYFGFLLWFGAFSFSARLRRGIQTAAALIALAMLVQHTAKYRELDRYIDEYLSVARSIEPNTTVFPILYSNNGEGPDGHELSHRVLPFANLTSWVTAHRGIVNLHNYEAWTGEFPLLYRDELNPARRLGTMLSLPSRVNFDGYSPSSRGEVTYVLVWSSVNHDGEARSQPVFRQLAESYDLVDRSVNGYARLYRRRRSDLN